MTLSFSVRRSKPVLVGPASPTPQETKRLSDLDDQEHLRYHVRGIFFYRGSPAPQGFGRDPVEVIRCALSEALVHYYPLAGRLREVEGRKLVVDCSGQGVAFVEADADVRLADLEADGPAGLVPPFPGIDQLSFEVEGTLLSCPLVLIQVTRLLCGGVVVWHSFNHTMCDATGIIQFINAVAELARGLPAPTVVPSWSRELLDARTPPTPAAFPHREYDDAQQGPVDAGDDMVISRSFVFRTSDIAAIRQRLPPHLRDIATSFEVLAAGLWRARTAALALRPDEEARLVTVVSARRHGAQLGLPAGYYGFTCAYVTVVMPAAGAGTLLMADVVERLREAKAAVGPEYVRSTADLLVLRGRPPLAMENTKFLVSDLRHVGFHQVDFGWGEPVYGGPSHVKFGAAFLVPVKNSHGEDVVAVSVALPKMAMLRFAAEIQSLLKV